MFSIDSGKFDSIIATVMKYLKEILAIFGLILFLIIFVRLVLWLLRCNISREDKQKKLKHRKIEGKTLNTKVKSPDEDKYSSQIEAIDKKDEIIDSECTNEQPEEMFTLLDAEQSSNTKPKFVIISEEQLPKSTVIVPDSESLSEEVAIKLVWPILNFA